MAPAETELNGVESRSNARPWEILRTKRRRLALALISLPLLLALPVRYWAFRMAGGWFVSTEIPADQRQMFLGLMYLLLMAAITCAAIFPGLLLLFVDNYRRVLTGLLLIPEVDPNCWTVFG